MRLEDSIAVTSGPNEQRGYPNLTELPLEAQRAMAREMARNEVNLTAGELAARFGRKPGWGRQQIAAAHMHTHGMKPQMLTVSQAAEHLGTPERYVRRLIEEERIDYVKLGDGRRSPVRIREDVLDAFVAKRTVKARNN